MKNCKVYRTKITKFHLAGKYVVVISWILVNLKLSLSVTSQILNRVFSVVKLIFCPIWICPMPIVSVTVPCSWKVLHGCFQKKLWLLCCEGPCLLSPYSVTSHQFPMVKLLTHMLLCPGETWRIFSCAHILTSTPAQQPCRAWETKAASFYLSP